MADIVASSQRLIEVLEKARPALDPEAERASVLKKVTKGLEKREAQKQCAKAKMNVKRSADSSKVAAAPKKAKTKKPALKKKD
ncbi:hypothetical protein GGH94_002932 [Coemansia aciculifera]|uniref:Uncharacterized protein n=1 Tax=Coemansia aciculifera TaxID=417176 RepID=A0A9W8IS26_9FUNG|nr:hypothetical protein GGH94_002932 [Coemansia aciculifera]KAJ2870170.1 hypothetical protein GGH93_005774 [Coemansia aciculifera]